MTMAPSYEGATPEQLRHHLVREFLGIHTMFRRELANMLRFVNELMRRPELLAGPQSRINVQQLAQASYQYTQLLHFHHHFVVALRADRHQRGRLAFDFQGAVEDRYLGRNLHGR